MSLSLSTDLAHDPLIAATYNTLGRIHYGKRIPYHDADKRKSVSWGKGGRTSGGSSSSSGGSGGGGIRRLEDPSGENTRSSGGNLVEKFKAVGKFKRKSSGSGKKKSTSGGGTRAGSRILLRRASQSSRGGGGCWGRLCGWCELDDEDSDMVEEWDDFTPKKIRGMGEDEFLNRLQQATRALGQRPGNYDIEMEIQKWHRTLEIEQKLYEESGKPKFKCNFKNN